MDCRLPGSSVHGILQARTMEWVAIFFPRGSFYPGIEPTSPALAVQFFTIESPGKSRFLTYLSTLKDNHGSWKEKLDLYIRYFFILLFSLVVTYSNQSLHHLLWERLLIIPNLCMQGLVVGQLAKYVCPQRKGRGFSRQNSETVSMLKSSFLKNICAFHTNKYLLTWNIDFKF